MANQEDDMKIFSHENLGNDLPYSPVEVTLDWNSNMVVHLRDSRSISIPLRYFPVLHKAYKESTEELLDYELSSTGIHWKNLNEDISVKGLLAKVLTYKGKEVNWNKD